MGAIIIVIGLELVPVATKMCGFIPSTPDSPLDTTIISLACGTLGVTALSSVLFRGFLKIIPILIGIPMGYVVAYISGYIQIDAVIKANMFVVPTFITPQWDITAILTIIPATVVVIVEHVGHLMVTSNMVGKDLSIHPGLHRSLLGNGISTVISEFLGSTPNTTYGEHIGVMAFTRVY